MYSLLKVLHALNKLVKKYRFNILWGHFILQTKTTVLLLLLYACMEYFPLYNIELETDFKYILFSMTAFYKLEK